MNQGVARDGRHFATCPAGLFDGFRVNRHRNILASSADPVRAYAQDGTRIGRVRVPELVSNICFGGPKRNRLFITAQTSLYAIYLKRHYRPAKSIIAALQTVWRTPQPPGSLSFVKQRERELPKTGG